MHIPGHRKRRFPWIAIAVLAGALLLRLWGAAVLPANGLYNVDEKTLTDSAVYLIGGQSPVILEWPAGFSLLLLYIVYGLKMLFSILWTWVGDPGVESFFHLMSGEIHAYNMNPWPEILMGRCLFAVISILPLALMIRRRWDKANTSERLAYILALFSPMWVIQSWSVLPDSITTGLWVYLIFYYLLEFEGSRKGFIRIGIVYGIIVSCKLTYLAFMPFFLLLPILHAEVWKERRRFLAVGLLTFGLTFLLCCPFILTDTLMMLKSFGGNFLSKMGGSGNSWGDLLGVHFPILMPWFGWLFVLPGIWYVFTEGIDKKKYVLLAVFLLLFFSAGSTGHLYTRYVLPLLPFVAWWAAQGLAGLSEGFFKQDVARIRSLGVVMGLILFFSVIHAGWDYVLLHRPSNLKACVEWIHAEVPTHSPISIGAELQDYILPDQTALGRIIRMNTDPVRIRQKRLTSFEIAGVEQSDSRLDPLMLAVSGDEESQAAFKSRISLAFAGEYEGLVYDVHYHHRYCENFQLQVDCMGPAMIAFDTGEMLYFITTEELPGKEPVQVFEGGIDMVWRVYE